MKPMMLFLTGSTIFALQAATLTLGSNTCNDPHRSGKSRYLSQRSYLTRDAQLAKIARQRFGIDEAAALKALQKRYPELNLRSARTKVVDCGVYLEARGGDKNYLFDLATLEQVNPKGK